MIIAREPHAIVGTLANARNIVQPYPTLTQNPAEVRSPINDAKRAWHIMVLAITGARMNQRMGMIAIANQRQIFSILDQMPGSV